MINIQKNDSCNFKSNEDKLKYLLQNDGERSSILCYQIACTLKDYKGFDQLLNENDEGIMKEILEKIAQFLEFHQSKYGNIIKRIFEGDNNFYYILKGKIGVFGLEYRMFYLTKEEYLTHLLKLYLLKEFNVLKDCLFKNKLILNIDKPLDIVKYCLNLDQKLYKNKSLQ